jgi:bifunctional UDP-N-acetylglucosamine pyrophosphorylase/glucosamine-1-phosphate N-acetyltransferase
VKAPVAVILAAGKSTRMKSSIPKVLHEICGRPMIEYVLDAVRFAGTSRILVVVGYQSELVRQALGGHADVEFVLQTKQRGTGHAVAMCADSLSRHDGPVIVLNGDNPLVKGSSVGALVDALRDHQAACVVGSAETDANEGLGRIVRDASGEFLRIVEQKDASPEEAVIREINCGCYAFDGASLLEALAGIRPNNQQAELYLTDCAAILKSQGKRVLALNRLNPLEGLGVNTRVQLADVERTMQQAHLEKLMLDGVTVVVPSQTWVDPRAKIGADTVLFPFTVVAGTAVIGENCRIGPHAVIQSSARIADGTAIGPFELVD